jgi:hypothetical protein
MQSKKTENVIENWKNNKGSIYPGDEVILEQFPKCCIYHKSITEYQNDLLFNDPKDYRFHLGLPAYPYVGDLENATVVALLLNPGFAPSNYICEFDKEYQKAHKKNLCQDHEDNEYPFYSINPQLCFHGGYDYWMKRLIPVIDTIYKDGDKSRLDIQKIIAKKFATIELVPYHSIHFKQPTRLLNGLESKKDIIKFVEQKILPKAIKGNIMLLVRSAQLWGITNDKYNQENIIIFQKKDKKPPQNIVNEQQEDEDDYNGSNRGFNLTKNTLKRSFNTMKEYLLK